MRRRLIAFLCVLVLAAGQPASAQWRADFPVLRIGIVAGTGAADARQRIEPFRLYLEDTLGVAIEIFASNDYPALISGQLTGRFHASFLTATAFAAASVACDACLEPLVAPSDGEGDYGFYSVLVTRPDSGIASPADLAGARLAVSGEDSVAGRLLPLALFAEAGVDPSTVTLVASSGPEEAVLRLLAGEADAALAWVGAVGDPAQGYDRGVLRRLIDAGALAMADIAIVWTSPLIPNGPLAVAADLPAELKADLGAAMVGLNAEPEVLAVANGGAGFVPVTAELYAPLWPLVTP